MLTMAPMCTALRCSLQFWYPVCYPTIMGLQRGTFLTHKTRKACDIVHSAVINLMNEILGACFVIIQKGFFFSLSAVEQSTVGVGTWGYIPTTTQSQNRMHYLIRPVAHKFMIEGLRGSSRRAQACHSHALSLIRILQEQPLPKKTPDLHLAHDHL